MRKAVTTIKGFSNYEIQITMWGQEWDIVDTRTGEKVHVEYDRRSNQSEVVLEDDTGVEQCVPYGVISQMIYPFLRDMGNSSVELMHYPEIDLEGDLWYRHQGRWITESERVEISLRAIK